MFLMSLGLVVMIPHFNSGISNSFLLSSSLGYLGQSFINLLIFSKGSFLVSLVFRVPVFYFIYFCANFIVIFLLFALALNEFFPPQILRWKLELIDFHMYAFIAIDFFFFTFCFCSFHKFWYIVFLFYFISKCFELNAT